MLVFIKRWFSRVWARREPLLYVAIYKLTENWALGKITDWLENQSSWFANMLQLVIDRLPALTWMIIPITIAMLLYLAWRDAKNQVGFTGTLKTEIIKAANKNLQERRVRINHDGLAWEDTGGSYSGSFHNPIAAGPFCPDDATRLLLNTGRSTRPVKSNDTPWHAGQGLLCAKCQKEFTLPVGKTVGESEDEAEAILGGMRRERTLGNEND